MKWLRTFAAFPQGRILAFGPPSLPGYGNASGFTFELQDRSGGSIEKLAEMITAIASPPKKRKKTKPTKGSKERRLKAKRQRSDTKRGRGGKWD